MVERLDAAAVTLDGCHKLQLRGDPIPVVIGRVCDEQPLLHTDQALAQGYADRIVRGLAAVALFGRAQRVVLAVDRGLPELLRRFQVEAYDTLLELVPLPARYPMDPASLVCDLAQAQQKSVPAAGLSHTLVLDAAALCDVALALEGRPALRRMVSVAGHVRHPAMLQVPLGTAIGDLVEACGGSPDSGWIALHNGLLGGAPATPDQVVGPQTRGVVIVPHRHPTVVRRSTPLTDQLRRVRSACVNCRVCTDVCPAFLDGGEHQPHLVMAAVASGLPEDSAQIGAPLAAAAQCRSCGLCSTLCPAALRPDEVVAEVSLVLQRLGLWGPEPRLRPIPDRPGRRQAVARLVQRLGLSGMDRPPEISARSMIPDSIRVPARSPAGGQRVMLVSAGETVAPGDRVALAPVDTDEVDCLAPVAGVVVSVDADDGVTILTR